MGLFDKKKEVPRLPRPEMKEGGFSLPDFPSANEFPQYDSSMKNDMGSIKKAINQPQKQQVMPPPNYSQYGDANQKKLTCRYPIEFLAKNDPIKEQALLNNYRIRSAQNLAKQRSTGK